MKHLISKVFARIANIYHRAKGFVYRAIYGKDFSLHSGERQAATNISEIRKDHTTRYDWAASAIISMRKDMPLNGADIFCGNGYGSYLISRRIPNAKILAVDACPSAIKQAEKNYQTGNINFRRGIFPFPLQENVFDFIVSLESIEHIEDDISFLKTIIDALKDGGLLVISTPNADKIDLKKNPNRFHYRHYVPDEFCRMLGSMGMQLIKQCGQDVYHTETDGRASKLLPEAEMGLKENYNGQFCVYLFKKIDKNEI